MTEGRVGFLCNIAFNLPVNNDTHKVLRSYYLMKCNEVTKGYGLPPKYFSAKVKCPHCYLDWSRDADVKVQPLKLSKKQRKRIRTLKITVCSKNKSEEQGCLLRNEMVQVCTFCRRSTKTELIKPERHDKLATTNEHSISTTNRRKEQKKAVNKQESHKKLNTSKTERNKEVVDLYTNAFDVFSLKNDKNTLSSTIKVSPKVIKNNKKRKDKFAGLCQKAVLASVQLKEQKEKQTLPPLQNKLNLFLKPSSG